MVTYKAVANVWCLLAELFPEIVVSLAAGGKTLETAVIKQYNARTTRFEVLSSKSPFLVFVFVPRLYGRVSLTQYPLCSALQPTTSTEI